MGFADNDLYFNAGVTYIDVRAWKERKYSEKLLYHINNVRNKYCNPDQDLFNMVLKGDTVLLPPGYNFQPHHRAVSDRAFFACLGHRTYYTASQIQEARDNPVILHTYRYLGAFPWHEDNLHPDTALFDSYLRSGYWADYQKQPAPGGWIFAVEKALYRLLSADIYFRLFEKCFLVYFTCRDRKLRRECRKAANAGLLKR